MSILFVGTYTTLITHSGEHAQGIYSFEFDSETGRLAPLAITPTLNPSYLAVHPEKKFLYVVNEAPRSASDPNGEVSAFRILGAEGRLELLGAVSSRGIDPCHLALDRNAESVVVANYKSGNVSFFPLEANGKLQEATSVEWHRRPSYIAHAHMIAFSRDNRFVYCVDLGIDEVVVSALSQDKRSLVPTGIRVTLPPGSGPRHLALHPYLETAYVLCERKPTIEVFHIDAENGNWVPVQSISTVEPGWSGPHDSAAIFFHPSGKFLYASNRAALNTLVAFRVDEKTGRLSLIESRLSLGRGPRSFVLHESGRFLLVANQSSGKIVTFLVDETTGRLIETGIETSVPMPVCLKFL